MIPLDGRLIWSFSGAPLLRLTFISVTPFSTGGLLIVRVPTAPPDVPGAIVPLMAIAPLTEPLPERVCAAPNAKPPVTDDTSNCAPPTRDRKSTRLNSSHLGISYAV